MKGDQLNIHHQLIMQCQRGDALAQEHLYMLYAKAMFNICKRMMGDEEEAKDLLQESFIDVFRKLSELRDINTFSAWIKRIVINNCINAIKKKRLIVTELKENYDVTEEEQDDFDFQKYTANKIMTAISRLPDGCKTVLNLYLFDGYDHKEIGQILSITESASKAQYSKARSRVRNMLDENEKINVG